MSEKHMDRQVRYVDSKKHPLYAIKAYVALIGATATALLGVFAADTQVGKVLTVIAVIATAVATYQLPNADVPESQPYDIEDGYAQSQTSNDTPRDYGSEYLADQAQRWRDDDHPVLWADEQPGDHSGGSTVR